jgi:DNA-binding phage protein
MAKTKTSKKQGASSIEDMPIGKLKKGVKTTKRDPTKNLRNAEFITRALAQCLLEGDKEEFMEILLAHWEIKKKTEALESVDLAKRTFYDLKKTANPRLDTIMKLTRGLNLKAG